LPALGSAEYATGMTPEEFRRAGHAAVDWIIDYYARVAELPVLSRAKAGEIYRSLPDEAPDQGEPFEAIVRDLDDKILPGVTHWQSPNFFAYFPANTSLPSILGDLFSAGLGVQGMLWATSPACTELETRVLDWLVPMLGLPERFSSKSTGGGVIQDSASSAALCAILAGRERASQGRTNDDGVDARYVAYTSIHAHSSIEKGIKIAGLGKKNLRAIEVDGNFAMRPDSLRRAIEDDLRAGKKPCFVCATVGTTSTLAIDPLEAIGAICKEHGIWLHVDAAMAGTAALCPELRRIHDGLEHADSYVFDAHKWMFTNFDCSCFYVADRRSLIDALSILPEYLRNRATESGEVFDYRDWHVPLGRRFRALKLWFVIRSYGVEGLRARVRRHVALAASFADRVRADPRFEIMAPPTLSLVCFRMKGSDEDNEALMHRLNASGALYLSHTKLDGKFTLRFSMAQTSTEERHVEAAWDRIRASAGESRAGESRA
jgi:aromatic-L-amino-acid decarboxylase